MAIAKPVMVLAIVNIMPNLFEHQGNVLDSLKSGSILVGGVGTGKSITALAFYHVKQCGGKIKINGKGEFAPMKKPRDLYIITTARKRDTLEWEQECTPFLLSTNPKVSIGGVKVVVDSWNNIKKYVGVKDAFFIFDEQRVVGSGTWVKSFIKIAKNNPWLLLSATPGDTWMDYVPVFLANGFYKNRTEFQRRHIVYSRFTKYPKVDHYIECGHLSKLRNMIVVNMHYDKKTTPHHKTVVVPFDEEAFKKVMIKRWNIFDEKPVKDVSELCYLLRRVVNGDPKRIEAVKEIIRKHPKMIVFYNFNYELELLRKMGAEMNITVAEWNGHKHEPVPKGDKWIYLVQYTAGAEGWNCIETDCTLFYSQNYSYKIMTQSAGRIDRLNTPFKNLFYFHLRSNSAIDLAISKAIKQKQDFNEQRFMAI